MLASTPLMVTVSNRAPEVSPATAANCDEIRLHG